MKLWFFLQLTASLMLPGQSELLRNWRRLFDDADLTFIFTPECGTHNNFPGYQELIYDNLYTPRRNIFLCRTASSFRYPMSLKTFGTRNIHKYIGRRVVFLSMDVPLGDNRPSKWEALLKIAEKELRQEYIFAQTSGEAYF